MHAEIKSIADRLAEAKKIKGNLCLNNGKPNGGSWRTPALDLALQYKSGYKGGETAQRFYMKFPVYRPRAMGAPPVEDDIKKVWEEQIAMTSTRSPNMLLESQRGRKTQYNSLKSKLDQRANSLNPSEKEILQKLKMQHFRANSINFGATPDKTLKFLNSTLIRFPKRERFNEDTTQVIEEIKSKAKAPVNGRLNSRTISVVSRNDEAVSQPSRPKSKHSTQRSLTKTELSNFFSRGKGKIDEEAKSRISQITKGSKGSRMSAFKRKFMKKVED